MPRTPASAKADLRAVSSDPTDGPDMPEPPDITSTIAPKRGRPAGTPNKSKGDTNLPGQTEIQDGLAALFSLIASVARSDAQFDRSDFLPEAKGLLSMAAKLPQLAVALGLLGPFVVFAGILRKLERIRAGRVSRAAREHETEARQDRQNVYQQATNGYGGFPSSSPPDLRHIDPATTYKEPIVSD